MSSPEELESRFITKMLEKDSKLRQEMADSANGESIKILSILQRRFQLYEDSMPFVNSAHNKILLSDMREGVAIQMMVYKTRYDFEEQISQIVTRLDDIENEVKSIKENLSPSS
jgi:hypothetical protein